MSEGENPCGFEMAPGLTCWLETPHEHHESGWEPRVGTDTRAFRARRATREYNQTVEAYEYAFPATETTQVKAT